MRCVLGFSPVATSQMVLNYGHIPISLPFSGTSETSVIKDLKVSFSLCCSKILGILHQDLVHQLLPLLLTKDLDELFHQFCLLTSIFLQLFEFFVDLLLPLLLVFYLGDDLLQLGPLVLALLKLRSGFILHLKLLTQCFEVGRLTIMGRHHSGQLLLSLFGSPTNADLTNISGTEVAVQRPCSPRYKRHRVSFC